VTTKRGQGGRTNWRRGSAKCQIAFVQNEDRDHVPTEDGEGGQSVRVSDRGCDYKMQTGTYILEVERVGDVLKSRFGLQNEGRDDIRPGGGEGG
jgi:hypothetical protein